MDSLLPSWKSVIECTVSGGYVVALTFVCLIQYLVYFLKIAQARNQAKKERRVSERLEHELIVVQKDRTLASLANDLLNEFIAEPMVDEALDLLLTRFVPDEKTDFAALLQFQPTTSLVHKSRGLSAESRQNLRLDASLIERLQQQGVVRFSAIPLVDCPLLSCLSDDDRSKAGQLFLIAIREGDALTGALLLTSLLSTDAPQERQIELIQRLMMSIWGSVRRIDLFGSRQLQLKSTQQMLDLSAICDLTFEAPLNMIETYMTRLMEVIRAEREAR